MKKSLLIGGKLILQWQDADEVRDRREGDNKTKTTTKKKKDFENEK